MLRFWRYVSLRPYNLRVPKENNMTISIFTKAQSSAIAMIETVGTKVNIAFQYSPSKVYTFLATPEFSEALEVILNDNIEGVSIGSTIAQARKNEQLVAIV
jgi:hypothetical protein